MDNLYQNIKPGWMRVLGDEFNKPYLRDIHSRLATYEHVPATADIFKAFELTDFDDVRVVILGQDPYTHGEATGLAFAVKEGRAISGSLSTILKRVEKDFGQSISDKRDLEGWAKQGVLLLNTILTAEPGTSKALSHGDWRW